MAFVARAERKLLLSTLTPSKGPGSYISHAPYKTSTSYAPFSSSTERGCDKANSNYTPGPGSYIDPIGRPRASTNSSSPFASNKPRFDLKQDNVPGPGAYNIMPNWSEKKIHFRSSNPVNWVRLPSAPSIPGPNQGYGYDESANGELMLHRGPDYIPGTVKDSVGPGHYDPKSITTAKAPLWHKSAVKREILPISKSAASVPGPGSYSTTKTTPRYQQKPNAVFMSSCKRGTELDLDESSEDGVPGPGKYSLKSSFTPSPLRPIPHNFGSGCERFKSTTPEAESLGPGQYNLPPSFRLKKGGSKAPFCSTNLRFQSPVELTPGPGSYKEINVQKKVWGKLGAFGCTEKRFYSRSNSNVHGKNTNTISEEGPGPGTYYSEVRVGMHNSAKNRGHSVFLSKAKRMADAHLKDSPSPGTYEITSSIGYVRPPPVPIHPVLVRENTSPRNVGFNAQAERFLQNNANAPGPGAYKVEESKKIRAVIVSKDKRFKELKPIAPGPGHYSEAQNWNKKTYNVLFE